MANKEADALSPRGAERIKNAIADYWKARGARGVVVERFQVYPGDPDSPWGVRSNLVGGLPRR